MTTTWSENAQNIFSKSLENFLKNSAKNFQNFHPWNFQCEFKGENWNRSRGLRKSWKFIKLYSRISQRVLAQITRSTRRWKAYDPYCWKNKKFCIRPQFLLICAIFEDKWNFWTLQVRTSSNIPLRSWKWGLMYLNIFFVNYRLSAFKCCNNHLIWIKNQW